MAAKILVTGATGTVGSNLVKELSAKAVALRACVHNKDKAEKIKGPGVEFAEVDYKRKKTIEAAFKGIDKLYLLTPFVPDQVETATMLVDMAKSAGVGLIVKQSGMGADAEPGITVGRLHRLVEKYIEASNIPYTMLRPNFFMQNFITYFGDAIKAEGKIYLPLGSGKVSYVDARDIARVAAAVLTKNGHVGKTYNITGPAAISVYDVALAFSKVTGKEVTYVDIPEDAAREGMRKAGMDNWSINCLLELHAICKAGYASAVTNTVEEITGIKPTGFERFAQDNARFLK